MSRIIVICFLLLPLPVLAQDQSRADVATKDQRSNWSDKRLVNLLRELADEAFERFVVTDKSRRVYGMTYEFERDGKQIQAFGLDAMHDGCWFMSALITAHRIDPEGGYLQRAQRYQVPFYVNMLTNSDRLFPHMIPRPGQEKFDAPVKGWAPRGWDDGGGFDLSEGNSYGTMDFFNAMKQKHKDMTAIEKDGDRITHAYFTSSHHLSQDLADSLLNVWLTTRDPETARAILLVHEKGMKYGHRIPVVQKAAGLANGLPDLYARSRPPQFDSAVGLRPLWQGLVKRKAANTGRSNDNLAWTWREECARAVLAEAPIAPGFLANAIGRVYAQTLVTEAFYGPEIYRPGFTLGIRGVEFKQGTGKLARRPDKNALLFARTLQYAWITAAALPEYRKDTAAWESAMKQLAADGTLAKIQQGAKSLSIEFRTEPTQVASHLDNYVLDTIDYWDSVRKKYGHLPRRFLLNGRDRGDDRFAELGAYAHLMKTIAFRLMDQQGVTERELIQRQMPSKPLLHEQLPDSVLKVQGLK